jgi:hypothetical protein
LLGSFPLQFQPHWVRVLASFPGQEIRPRDHDQEVTLKEKNIEFSLNTPDVQIPEVEESKVIASSRFTYQISITTQIK